MKNIEWRSLRAAGRLTFVLALGLAVHMPSQVVAAQRVAPQTLVISNDRGGLIGERARLIERIKTAQARVEIRGNICYSACTMYLGADNICINPTTVFGFHGPSRNGRALPAQEFEHWSNVMARYYPNGLRQWFMQTARYSESNILRISGADLIRAGYTRCLNT